MGRVAAAALSATDGFTLRAGFARSGAGAKLVERIGFGAPDAMVYDDIDAFVAAGLDVVLDFTAYPVSTEIARAAVSAGISPVVGTTGWTEEDRLSFADQCDEAEIGALIVPNFAIGAVLMIRFAEEAVRHLSAVEIIEMHHAAKRDAPSGTALLTANRIGTAGGPSHVPIHSVRLPGFVAHQEVIFGGVGETLTIRHDANDREAFASGIVLAARRVRELSTLAVGLDALLFDDTKNEPL